MAEIDFYDNIEPIVIDIGETKCKLGLGADKTCRYVVPTLIAQKDGRVFVGEKAEKAAHDCVLRCPLSRGIVQDWEDLETIISHCLLNEMRIAPEEHTVLVTEPCCSPASYREHMAQILFESLGVLGFYPANRGVLSIMESGITTGVSVDVEEGTTCVLPMHKGCVFREAVCSQNLGGYDVTMRLKHLLQPKAIVCQADVLFLRELKQRFCFTAFNYTWARDNASPADKSYVQLKLNDRATHAFHAPDNILRMNSERFEAPEVLFQPSLRTECSESVLGLPEFVYNCIMKCEVDVRRDLFNSVVLSGDTTTIPGFVERFHHELKQLVEPQDYTVKVIAPPERNKSVWLGGSILSSVRHMTALWISKEEYAEYGPDIVHRMSY